MHQRTRGRGLCGRLFSQKPLSWLAQRVEMISLPPLSPTFWEKQVKGGVQTGRKFGKATQQGTKPTHWDPKKQLVLGRVSLQKQTRTGILKRETPILLPSFSQGCLRQPGHLSRISGDPFCFPPPTLFLGTLFIGVVQHQFLILVPYCRAFVVVSHCRFRIKIRLSVSEHPSLWTPCEEFVLLLGQPTNPQMSSSLLLCCPFGG